MRSNLADRKLVLLIFVAVSIRGLFLCFYPITPVKGDAGGYVSIADNLLAGKGFVFGGREYPSVRRGPVYPGMIACIFAISGRSVDAVRWVQIVLDTCTVYLLYLIGSRLFSNRIGLVAASLYCFYLPAIAACSVLLMETLLALLATMTLYAMIEVLAEGGRKNTFMLGGIIGLSVLTRPTGLFLLPFLIGVLLLLNWRYLARHYRLVLGAFLVSIITVCPWTIRNYLVFDAFVPVSFGGGQALHTGNHIKNDGNWNSWEAPDIDKIREEAKKINTDPKMRLIIMDKIFMREAVNSMVKHPGKTSTLFFKKFTRFFGRPATIGYKEGAMELGLWTFPVGMFAAIYYYIVLFGFVLFLIKRPKQMLLLMPVIIICYYTILHVVTFAIPRYHFPIIPILCLCGAYGYVSFLHRNSANWQCVTPQQLG